MKKFLVPLFVLLIVAAVAVGADLSDTGSPGWMGMESFSSPEGSIESGHDGTGAFVVGILPEGPSGGGELKMGDLLVSYNNTPVMNDVHLEFMIGKTTPGSAVPVTVIRGIDRKRIDFTVDIGAMPSASEEQELFAAHRKEMDAARFNWLAEMAENDFEFAHASLADMYKWCENRSDVLEWLKTTADAGRASSMTALGEIYLEGDGVERDAAAAITWFESAAGKGDGYAMIKLAEMYRDGDGVEKDNGKAIAWYKDAVETGDSHELLKQSAFFQLGLLHEDTDSDAAKEWYAKAKEAGHWLAEEQMKEMEKM